MRDLGRPQWSALVAGLWPGLGWAASRITMVSRDGDGAAEVVIVGGTLGQFVSEILLAGAGFWLFALWLSRAHPTRVLRPLHLWACLPVAGLLLAMFVGPAASLGIYFLWELSWWSLAGAAALCVARARPDWSAAAGRRGERFVASGSLGIVAAGLVGWALVSNTQLRASRIPMGDEPRYLRYCEAWIQGLGTDVSGVRPAGEVPHATLNVVHLVKALGLAAAVDARLFAADMSRYVRRDPTFQWSRAGTDSAWMVAGWNGGSYQVHQPGLALLLLPAYAMDRARSTGWVYDNQFPERRVATFALLSALYVIWGVALARLCSGAGMGRGGAVVTAVFGLACLPASAMVYQIYPEVAAGMLIGLVLVTLLSERRHARWRAILAGTAAGALVLLHVRFLGVSAVLLLLAIWALRRQVSLAVTFAICWSAGVLLQCWFAYHATGSPLPVALYSGSEAAALTAGPVAFGIARSFFDRDWGILAHAPILLLAPAGFVALWRTRRAVAIAVAAVVITLVATASMHGVNPAGGTPTRFIAAVVPLLMIPAALAVADGWDWRGWRYAALVLAILSIDQAWVYNTLHIKEVGILVAQGVTGWRINLLFPYMAGDVPIGAWWLLLAWCALLGVSVWWALRPRGSRTTRAAATAWLAAGLLLVTAMTGADVWSNRQPRYARRVGEAREALAQAYAAAGGCHLCWSSSQGLLSGSQLAPNRVDDLRVDAARVNGRTVSVVVLAAGADGAPFGAVALDFGDGSPAVRRLMVGSMQVSHTYHEAGEYRASAWFRPPGGTERGAATTVAVR